MHCPGTGALKSRKDHECASTKKVSARIAGETDTNRAGAGEDRSGATCRGEAGRGELRAMVRQRDGAMARRAAVGGSEHWNLSERPTLTRTTASEYSNDDDSFG